MTTHLRRRLAGPAVAVTLVVVGVAHGIGSGDQIDAVEAAIGSLQGELAQLERQLGQSDGAARILRVEPSRVQPEATPAPAPHRRRSI